MRFFKMFMMMVLFASPVFADQKAPPLEEKPLSTAQADAKRMESDMLVQTKGVKISEESEISSCKRNLGAFKASGYGKIKPECCESVPCRAALESGQQIPPEFMEKPTTQKPSESDKLISNCFSSGGDTQDCRDAASARRFLDNQDRIVRCRRAGGDHRRCAEDSGYSRQHLLDQQLTQECIDAGGNPQGCKNASTARYFLDNKEVINCCRHRGGEYNQCSQDLGYARQVCDGSFGKKPEAPPTAPQQAYAPPPSPPTRSIRPSVPPLSNQFFLGVTGIFGYDMFWGGALTGKWSPEEWVAGKLSLGVVGVSSDKLENARGVVIGNDPSLRNISDSVARLYGSIAVPFRVKKFGSWSATVGPEYQRIFRLSPHAITAQTVGGTIGLEKSRFNLDLKLGHQMVSSKVVGRRNVDPILSEGFTFGAAFTVYAF